MNKKRIYWIVAGIVLLVAVGRRSGRENIAHIWAELMKSRTQQSPVIQLRQNGIDSLYAEKAYRYFLFVREGQKVRNTAWEGAIRDSMLILVAGDVPPRRVAGDICVLPPYAFEFLLKEHQSTGLFKVIGVTKDDKIGNLYKLMRWK